MMIVRRDAGRWHIRSLSAFSRNLQERIQETDGEPRLLEWRPWVMTPPTLFERWNKNAMRYLVLETGEIFKAPRPAIVGDR